MGIPVYQNGDRILCAKDVLSPLVKGGYLSQAEGERLLKVWTNSKEHPLNLVISLTLSGSNGKKTHA